MRNRFIVLALVVLAALSVSGLTVAQDQVQIQLAGWSANDQENAALQAQVDAFMAANPDVAVEVILAPEYETFMQTGFASGDYPNVFYVDSFRLQDWASAGVLEPWGDSITDPDDIYPSLRDVFTYEEQLYCAPKDFSTLGLIYNVDMLEAAGVEVPTDWASLAAAAEATATDEIAGLTTGVELPRVLPFIYQNGGSIFGEDGSIAFESDATVEAMQYVIDLYTSGAAKSPADLGAGWAGEAFGQGLAAMTIEGNWIIQYMLDQFPDINWGVAELPAGSAGNSTMVFTVCYGVAAAANNDQVEASIRLADFLTGPEGAMMVAESGFGVMPARLSAADTWLTTRGEEYAAFVDGAAYAQRWSFPPGFGTFIDTFNSGLNEAVQGNLDAIDLVADAAEAGVEALEESM
jgi:multiple sugar transport system substrate-binding protein